MFGGTYISESLFDLNATNFSGILGIGGDIAYVLIFLFLAVVSIEFIMPSHR